MMRYFQFVLRHRALVTIVCLVITIIAALAITRATMATSIAKLVLGETPEYARYQELIEQYASDEQLVIGWKTQDGDAARLRVVIPRIEQMPEVRRVQSLLAFGQEQPFARGVLASDDGLHQAVAIELRTDESRSLEDAPRLVESVREIFDQAGISADRLHAAGTPAILAEIDAQTRHNIFRLAPAVAIAIAIMTLLLLRRPWPVFMALVIGFVAIIWTMGFAITIEREVSIVLAAVPALILLISFSDVVHLYNAYLVELQAGRGREDALNACAAEVGRACVHTSLTTLVGFLGLTLLDIPLFRQVGLVLGVGVAIALLLAMTIVPIMLSVLPTPPAVRSRRSGPTRVISISRKIATNHPWPVIIMSGLIAVAMAIGIARVRFETDLVQRMGTDNPLRTDAAYFDQHFSGTSTIDLYVTAPDRPDIDARCQTALATIPDITRVISTPSLAPADDLAPTRRYVLFVRQTGTHAIFEIGETAKSAVQATIGPDATVEATGLLYLAGHWLETHLAALITPLVISLAVIAIMMMIIVRSIPMGLLAMIPNLIPLLIVGGVLGFAMNPADSDVIVAILIALGIAVDDTIHFMTRYRTERARSATVREAISRTYDYAGHAILVTSLIFAVGFAPFLLADYLTLRLLGTLIPITMIAAVIGDLLLLPALVLVVHGRSQKSNQTTP